jgi:hypothetical protein
MTTDSATLPPSESPAPNPSAPAAPIARPLGWLAASVLGLLWAYAVYRLGTLWYTSADYAYGWFVPLLCLALFWERWKHRPAPELLQAATAPLIVFAVLSLTLLPSCLFLEVIPYWRFAGWAFAGAIIGITFCALYLIGGRSWVHHFAFPPPFLRDQWCHPGLCLQRGPDNVPRACLRTQRETGGWSKGRAHLLGEHHPFPKFPSLRSLCSLRWANCCF